MLSRYREVGMAAVYVKCSEGSHRIPVSTVAIWTAFCRCIVKRYFDPKTSKITEAP